MGKLYRTMKQDSDGAPRVGQAFDKLGARPNKDIPVDANGNVQPRTGGMSTTLDDPKKMRRAARPRALDGESREPLFALDETYLAPELVHAPDPKDPSHRFVEPAAATSFDQYQKMIHETRECWIDVPLEGA